MNKVWMSEWLNVVLWFYFVSQVDMPLVRKTYKKQYGVDITEDIKSKPHPTQKCLLELACKVPTTTKKVMFEQRCQPERKLTENWTSLGWTS